MSDVEVAVAALPLLGLGLCGVLADSGRSAAFVGDVVDLRDALPRLSPRVVVVDVALTDALDGVDDALRSDSRPVVVVLGDDDEGPQLLAAIRAGATGVLPRDISPCSAVRALKAAARGESLLPRHLVPQVLADLRLEAAMANGRAHEPSRSHGAVLTPRECDVLEMMRAGLSTAVMAERLVVAPVTVRTHVWAVRRKLHLSTGRGTLVPAPRRTLVGVADLADDLADDVAGHLAHLRIS